MENIIQTEGLYKTYYKGNNRIEALKNVNLSIAKGESVAIIGPSGAGKSTLLHIIGGLDTPSNGTVLFEGRDLYRQGDKERSRLRNKKIGFVFQFYNLLSEFTILENVIIPVLINRNSGLTRLETRKKAELLLSRLELKHRLNHRPRELSGGEAQRAAIARALINEPDIILCDEPTGNLDSNMGEQIYNIIFSLNNTKQMTVVVVTHQARRDDLFDRTYFIKDGAIIKPIETAELVKEGS